MSDVRVSSFCLDGSCITVEFTSEHVYVYDPPAYGRLTSMRFTVDEWRAFVLGVKAGEFDA